MSSTPGRFDREENIPLPEWQSPAHPNVIFRAHSNLGRHHIMHLGGEDYWVSGTWMVQSGSRMMVLRDRLFRIGELSTAIPGVEFVMVPPPSRPAASGS